MITNGKALILYATMTNNTEKIANWFKESFEHYNFATSMFRLSANFDWKGAQDKLYFDDYDVVCLGSPIVGGGPLMIVTRALSLGGGGVLEKSLSPAEKAASSELKIESVMPKMLVSWRRNHGPYRGVLPKDEHQPLGVVFTTYGGGFYGSDESLATLELLKLYLELNDVKVIGKFACCGKETGPAGLADGEIPKPFNSVLDEATKSNTFHEPRTFRDADGNTHVGSFFFHTHMNSKPGPRDEAKAKALIADIVEDYFFSYDGQRKRVGSQYISIS